MSGIEYDHNRRRWVVTCPDQTGTVHHIGDYATRDEANAAYKTAHAKVNPPPEPTVVDPNKHHSLSADNLETSGPEGGI